MEFGRTTSARSDFIGGIDNEALDFGQIEAFIHCAGGPAPTAGVTGVAGGGTQTHLPESPPDSGSEPPYSPADLHSLNLLGTNGSNHPTSNSTPVVVTQVQQVNDLHHSGRIHPLSSNGLVNDSLTQLNDITQQSIDLGTVNEIQTHNHLLNNPNIFYLTTTNNDGSQPTNTNLSRHDNILLTSVVTEVQEQKLLLELNNNNNNNNTNNNNTGRLYRNELLDIGNNGHSNNNITTNNHNTTEQLNRILPDLYQQQDEQQLQQQQQQQQHLGRDINTNEIHTRKRKHSQHDNNQSPAIVKAEPDRPTTISPSIRQSTTVTTNIDTETANNTLNGLSQIQNDTNIILDTASQNGDSTSEPCPLQCIRFNPFQQQNWHTLCDQNLQELPPPHYRVDADKGFNFSNSDDAFVCQKKNHFQITCHAQLQGSAVLVKTSGGLEKVRSFHLHFYGVKLEAPTQTIRVEQSQSDRSKKPFHPVPIELQNGQVSKITVGRLHFSETTSNNMRKKGRPNPEQRYFQLIVGLHAHTNSGNFPVISHGSERIIVRASNPGQFESDVELCWQRGLTQDSIFHSGRVGINTDRPDECLVVNGNVKISGHILQPSDLRIKKITNELNTKTQLNNLIQLRIVNYDYDKEFAANYGLSVNNKNKNNNCKDTGIIAQELKKILPDAVYESGNIHLPSGTLIENFLVVNKDRLLMETIGAVKELYKRTTMIEKQLKTLETFNLNYKNYLNMNCSKNNFLNFIKIFLIIFLFTIGICFSVTSLQQIINVETESVCNNNRNNNLINCNLIYLNNFNNKTLINKLKQLYYIINNNLTNLLTYNENIITYDCSLDDWLI